MRLPVLLLLLLAPTVLAQPARLVTPDDWAAHYIERLQRRGHLLELNPTLLPYREADLRDALHELDPKNLSPTEQGWVDLLRVRYDGARPDGERHDSGAVQLGLHAGAGGLSTTNDRLDPLRFLDVSALPEPAPLPEGEPLDVDALPGDERAARDLARLIDPGVQAGPFRFHYSLHLNAWMAYGDFIAQAGGQANSVLNEDPDGLDVVLRRVSRVEDSYVGYGGKRAGLYVGRYAQHWGIPGQTALLLSDNPRTFDQIGLRLGGERFSLHSTIGELDSVTDDGRFTGRVGERFLGDTGVRRYLAAHRFDWRPTKHFGLAFMEAVVYSGPNASLSPKFFNPASLFLLLVDNTPKNDENNGFAAGLIWGQIGKLTLQGQLLLDDLDVLNASEPASVALAGTATLAGVRPWLDLGLEADAVSGRAYNTTQPEGRYLFAQRGLGTQFSDYLRFAVWGEAYADAFVPGLMVQPRAEVLLQGIRDPRQPYPTDEEAPTFLDGTLERTLRLATRVRYQPIPNAWIRADFGVNLVGNENNVEGVNRTRFVGIVEAGVSVQLERIYQMGF
ncbi:MAG: capsule assembly Wzi family protein [Bacteroidota bacterium]